jgi:hypothetical protein
LLEVLGKILETVGAIFLAYVALRAARLEILIAHPLDQKGAANPDLDKLKEGLKTVLELRKKQFGFYEAILVGTGASLIALGCGLYLLGLLMGGH